VKLRINLERLAALPAAEQARVRAELLELEALRRANPLAFYEPHAKQRVFHAGRDPLKAFLGGNRSGKTTAGIVDDLIQTLDPDVVPEHLLPYKHFQPPFYCRIIIPDLTNTLDKVVLQKVREWAPPAQLAGGTLDRAWSEKQRVLTFANGSWWQFFSNDQDLDKFGGAALHRVHYDEEPREDIRKESLMRLIDYGGDEVFTMTPLLGMSWMFVDIYEPWTEGRLTDATIVLVDMDENPHLDAKTKERALAGLSHEERAARKSGRFVHFAGLIYDTFDVARHVHPELDEVPRDAPLVLLGGIDNGIRHMAAVLLTFLDADDVLWVFDELPLQGLTVSAVAEQFLDRCARWGIRTRFNIIDPASRRTEEQTGRSIRDAYRAAGVSTLLGVNDRLAGINAVKERLEGDRLRVTANCTELIREFKRYRWARQAAGENEAKETPVRRDDHLLDALRYICMSPTVRPKRPSLTPSQTLQDRILRANLERLNGTAAPEHPLGGGIFA